MRISTHVTALALVACAGGQSSRVNEPISQTETTGVVVEGGPASPGDPMGLIPESEGVKATSGSVASPMEGECPRGSPSPRATDLASCTKSCQGMNDTVPLGSRCVSRLASCRSQCLTAFRSQ